MGPSLAEKAKGKNNYSFSIYFNARALLAPLDKIPTVTVVVEAKRRSQNDGVATAIV